MSKLPVISGKDLVRALEKGGFSIKRQSGSHIILEHRDGRIAAVPVHGNEDLPKGTLAGILRDAEVTREALRKLL